MRSKIREWADDIIPNARYGIFEWVWLGCYPVLLAAAQAYWAYWQEAAWPMKILTAIGLFFSWWIILALWHRFFPKSRTKPPRQLSVLCENDCITALNKMDDGDECSLVVQNVGIETIEDIELEIIDMFGADDPKKHVGGLDFPIRLSTMLEIDPPINPGAKLRFPFLWQARVVETPNGRFVHGLIVSSGASVAFRVGQEYPVSLALRAKDMIPKTEHRRIRFSLDGYPCLELL